MSDEEGMKLTIELLFVLNLLVANAEAQR